MKPEDITDEMRNRAAREYKRQLARDGNCIDFGEILVAALTEEIEVTAIPVKSNACGEMYVAVADVVSAMESVRRRGEKHKCPDCGDEHAREFACSAYMRRVLAEAQCNVPHFHRRHDD